MDENKNLQGENIAGQDVVVFSPEMLRLVEDRQRRVREQLLDCREAAESGDGHAQVQMGLNHLYGTNGAEKDLQKVGILQIMHQCLYGQIHVRKRRTGMSFVDEIDNSQKCVAVYLVRLAYFFYRSITET